MSCLPLRLFTQTIPVIVDSPLTIFFLQSHRKRESLIFTLSEYQSLALNNSYYLLTLSKKRIHAVIQCRYNFWMVIVSLCFGPIRPLKLVVYVDLANALIALHHYRVAYYSGKRTSVHSRRFLYSLSEGGVETTHVEASD